jgi:flagellin
VTAQYDAKEGGIKLSNSNGSDIKLGYKSGGDVDVKNYQADGKVQAAAADQMNSGASAACHGPHHLRLGQQLLAERNRPTPAST